MTFTFYFYTLTGKLTSKSIPPTQLTFFMKEHLSELQKLKGKNDEISMVKVLNTNKKVLDKIHVTHITHKNEQAKQYMMLGEMYIRISQLNKAEKIFIEILKKFQNENNSILEHTLFKLKIYNYLIKIYTTKGEYLKGRKLINLVTNDSVMKQLINQPQMLIFRVNELNLYIKSGLFSLVKIKAKKYLLDTENITDNNEKNTIQLQLLNFYAIALRQLEDLDGAVIILERLLALQLKLGEQDHDITISRFSTLGAIYMMKGNLTQAQHYFSEAVNMNTIIYSGKSFELPVLLNNLSYASFENQQIKVALDQINEAISVQTKLFGKHNPKLAYLYLTRANHKFNLGKIFQAEKDNNIALDLFKHADNKEHPFRGRSLALAAFIYKFKGDTINCTAHIKMAKIFFSESQHRDRQAANIIAKICTLTIQDNDTKQSLMESIKTLLIEFTQKYGKYSLPVLQLNRNVDIIING